MATTFQETNLGKRETYPVCRVMEDASLAVEVARDFDEWNRIEGSGRGVWWVKDERCLGCFVSDLQVELGRLDTFGVKISRYALGDIVQKYDSLRLMPDLQVEGGLIGVSHVTWESSPAKLDRFLRCCLSSAEAPYPDGRNATRDLQSVDEIALLDRVRAFVKENPFPGKDGRQATVADFHNAMAGFEIPEAYMFRNWMGPLGLWPRAADWFRYEHQWAAIAQTVQAWKGDGPARIGVVGTLNGEESHAVAAALVHKHGLQPDRFEVLGVDLHEPNRERMTWIPRFKVDTYLGREKSTTAFKEMAPGDCLPHLEGLPPIALRKHDITKGPLEECAVVLCNGVLLLVESELRTAAIKNVLGSVAVGGKAFLHNQAFADKDGEAKVQQLTRRVAYDDRRFEVSNSSGRHEFKELIATRVR